MMNPTQLKLGKLKRALTRRGKTLMAVVELQRQMDTIKAVYPWISDFDMTVKNIKMHLESAQLDYDRSTLALLEMLDEIDDHDLPQLPDSYKINQAISLGVNENQLEMLWTAEDPFGDVRIHFCDPNLSYPGFGLIILDHNYEVTESRRPHSSRPANDEFEHYRKFLLGDDPRQIWMMDKFDQMLEAQYLDYTKDPDVSHIIAGTYEYEQSQRVEETNPKSLASIANYVRSMWTPATD